MSDLIKGGLWRQYFLASFLGATPGCLGAFMNVSLYVHGMIGFEAIVGGMIATSGDEAFVMLTQFPGMALALFSLLFVAGILCAWISDKFITLMGVIPCESCLETHCDHCISSEDEAERIADIFRLTNLFKNFRSLSFTRFLLLALILSFMVLVALGIIGSSVWDWKRITFIALCLSSLYIAIIERKGEATNAKRTKKMGMRPLWVHVLG